MRWLLLLALISCTKAQADLQPQAAPTTEYTVRKTMCLVAAKQAAANAAMDAAGFGPKTFQVCIIPTSPPDTAPCTHYCTDWVMTPAQETLVTSTLSAAGVTLLVNATRASAHTEAVPRFATSLSGAGLRVKPKDDTWTP